MLRDARPPVLFSLSRRMIQADIRGGYRLWSALHASGALDRTVRYDIEGTARSVPIFVPLNRPVSSWSAREIARYEHRVVEMIARRMEAAGGPFRLVDCGADIGMVATALARRCAQVEDVTAFEPNEQAFSCLTRTLAEIGVPARAHSDAVGASTGRGRLVVPDGADAHAAFIRIEEGGPVAITRLDDALPDDTRGIALKIDVEGGELAVVEGAMRTLSTAASFVVAFEAHRDVAARTGLDPVEVLRRLAEIAPLTAALAELPDMEVRLDTPLFEQVDTRPGGYDGKVVNVIAWPTPSGDDAASGSARLSP